MKRENDVFRDLLLRSLYLLIAFLAGFISGYKQYQILFLGGHIIATALILYGGYLYMKDK